MLLNLYPVLILLATTHAHCDDWELYEPPPLAPREAWLARPPSRPLPNTTLPAETVILQLTGGEECHVKCMKRVANLQTFQMDAVGLDDISYNFLIGGDGVVYVGRGWYKKSEEGDDEAITVAFIGDFNEDVQPNDYQLLAFDNLMQMGLHLDLLTTDFVIVGTNGMEHSFGVPVKEMICD